MHEHFPKNFGVEKEAFKKCNQYSRFHSLDCQLKIVIFATNIFPPSKAGVKSSKEPTPSSFFAEASGPQTCKEFQRVH